VKQIIIISIIAVIVAVAVGLAISQETVDAKPWTGLDCNEMLDFSASEEHTAMDIDMHIEFHTHFIENCSDMEMDMTTPEMKMDMTNTEMKLISEKCSGIARCMEGSVTKIVDGDTIHVDGESVRFALSSAPELKVFGGIDSRNFIDTICPVGSDVIVDEDDSQTEGSYGRIIGVVYCNGLNLNQELLDADLGYLENQFCDSSEFAEESWAIKHGC
jgi:hypothetical protein